ncbi:uncharacterized protein LOC143032028 [Oratosquilla oratoria]|uniref:uncharacterized protein LOC143032028 n=1 Tax=Oratosquilla oratoria TaxID=337810 RepID=UPI003F757F4E
MAKRSLTEEEYLQALFVSSDEEEPSIVTFEADALSALPLLMPGPSFCVQSAINLHVTRISTTSVTSAIARDFAVLLQQCFHISQLKNSSTFKKTLVISGIWYSKVYSACYLTKCLFLQFFRNHVSKVLFLYSALQNIELCTQQDVNKYKVRDLQNINSSQD